MADTLAPNLHGTPVIDDRALPLEAPEAAAPRRRRGRPPGARAKTSERAITADDITFLRALAQGVDSGVAAEQYLLHLGVAIERRGGDTYAERLRARVLAMASTWPELAEQAAIVWPEGLAPDALAEAAETELPPAWPAAAPRPTLEEFAQRFDPDMYSEAELVERFEEEFGAAAPDAQAPPPVPDQPRAGSADGVPDFRRKLHALDWMDRRLAVRPQREDAVSQWLALSSAQEEALRVAGVVSLGNLRDWMTLKGVRWWNALPRYGRVRGRRLQGWLDQSGIVPSAGLVVSVRPPGAVQVYAGELAPLSEMKWPMELRGAEGGFRGTLNTLGAQNDLQAIQKWFATLRDNSRGTQDGYRRAIERLALWAIMERGRAISALETQDLLDFFDFLRAPPAHWVQARVRTRTATDWRPLKGPLNSASMLQTSVAVRKMLAYWHGTGYLALNAATEMRGPKRTEVKMDVMRSFSEQDKEIIRGVVAAMDDGPRKRRLVAMIRLLQTAGLRRNEAASMTWAHMERVRLDGAVSDNWALRFEGKGKRERIVPLQDATIEALEAHRADRIAMAATGELNASWCAVPGEMPLLGIIDERLTGASMGSAGDMPHNARREGNATGCLSSARIYGLLKGFFKECAKQAGPKNSDFLAASTHWLRHTFAHDTLAANEGHADVLPVTQTLLGHASISTTMIYVKADVSARKRAVDNIQSIV
ncbi:tyrosine-type recombinase/integrase [Acidovorax sp.]|uniref:tyrosine-type recombinase/integrase n=1 Tax=Acidovorax sp. TaxID=1872122 RepID=UPI0027BA245F|nr:tyrosine-type recombinase/integrase [Acidovorax sp.]